MIKEACKGGPKWPNIGKPRDPNWSTKGTQNAAECERTDRSGQTPPRATREAYHRPWWVAHDRAPCHVRPYAPVQSGFFVFFLDCSFFDGFCWFLPLKLQYIWTYSAANSLPSTLLSYLLDFRVVLVRESGRGEECKDSGSGLWIERLKHEFSMSNSFPSLLFSHFNFMLCNFCFGFAVWSWILCEFEFYFSIFLLILGIFEFIGWFYRFLNFNCLVRNLITFLHVLGFGWWTERWNLKPES